MITLTKNGNAIVFTFSDNAHYLFDGTIEVPVNSLTLITDNSQMATFKKSASNDIFISATYAELGMSKSELESWFKENACGSTGGGGVTSGEVETMIDQAVSGKQDTLIAGSGITISGNVISSEGGNKVVELTQAQYDALVDKDPDTFYIITDAEAIDINNYYNKTEVDNALANKADTSAVTEAISSAVSGKVNTSAYNTYTAATDSRLAEDEEVTAAGLNALNDALGDKADTSAVTASIAAAVSGKQDTLIAGSGITISGNVISSEGGGATYSAGTNISIANDTINCTLPISVTSSNQNSITIGNTVGNAYGNNNILAGNSINANYSNSVGIGTTINLGANNTFGLGENISTSNVNQLSCGFYNISNKANSTKGDSGNTLVSVGNGYIKNPIQARHNAFEIRQNGDIYFSDTDNTTYQNYYEKPMVRLQDMYAALGGLSLVKITQAAYDALATKDPNTLYIVTDS